MDEVNLEEVFLSRTPMLKSCPGFLRGRFRHCFCVALRERYRAKLAGDAVAEERLGSCSALSRSCCSTDPKVAEVSGNRSWQNANKFGRKQWRELLASSQEVPNHPQATDEQDILTEQKRRGRARARQELIGATLAPKTRETLAELQGRRPQERVREIPDEVMASNPTRVNLDNFTFVECTFGQRSWPRRMHLRNAQSVFGCCRSDPPVVSGSRRFSQGGGTRNRHQCHRDVLPQIGGQDSGPSIRESGRHARHFSLPCPPFQALIASATRSRR